MHQGVWRLLELSREPAGHARIRLIDCATRAGERQSLRPYVSSAAVELCASATAVSADWNRASGDGSSARRRSLATSRAGRRSRRRPASATWGSSETRLGDCLEGINPLPDRPLREWSRPDGIRISIALIRGRMFPTREASLSRSVWAGAVSVSDIALSGQDSFGRAGRLAPGDPDPHDASFRSNFQIFRSQSLSDRWLASSMLLRARRRPPG